MKKRILSIVTALALTIALLPAAAMPACASSGGRKVSVSDSNTFNNAIENLQDGDTIQLTKTFVVTTRESNNDSLVIDKNVTIDGQGHGLSLRYAGVLLGADVTFKDVTLGLASNVRPALIANGHTLILDGVTRDPTNRNINLFCGSQTGATQGDLAAQHQGDHGQIIIKHNTYLGPTGRIFAGSISTDGKNNVFDKPATVTIDSSVTGDSIGELYACGALETYTSTDDWFNYENEIDPPFASPGTFQVSGKVTFNLYQGKVRKVSGDTGVEGNLAQVNYNGSTYLNDNLVLSSIGGLTVESGNLAPAAGRLVQNNVDTADRTSEIVSDPDSNFFGDNAPMRVDARATLGLQKLVDEVTVGDFTGGGSLVLGENQKLVVSGAVSGTTTLGIGSIFNGHSQKVPNTEGHIYINAANSNADSFTLATPASRPDIELVCQSGGIWKAEEGHKSTNSIVDDFALTSVLFDPSDSDNVSWFATLPFGYVKYAPNSAEQPIAFIPLTIKVNGNDTSCVDDSGSFTYKTDDLELAIAGKPGEEELQISTISPDDNQVIALTGSYLIEVTVPAENSGTGQPITRSATLTIKEAGRNTPIPVPAANTGLVYNKQLQVGVPLNEAYTLSSGATSAINAGKYTATVTPAEGFEWADGSSGSVDIFWEIAKADNFEIPAELDVTSPTAYGGSDGKITGTTTEMEYADNENFTSAKACSDDETTGLTAGGYYVRIAASPNYKAGPAVQVTVPQGPVTIRSIAIDSSSSYKNYYFVGEPLDVTGLVLTVTMSDNSTRSVPVVENWVSDFNSSAEGRQTLTITYGGQTVSYDITIDANTNPVTSIAISSTNHKTQYKVGEPLDVTGLTLTVRRQTGDPEEINVLSNMVSGFNSGSPMESQVLTVSYGGKTTTYTISISENTGTDPIAVAGVTLNKSATTLTAGNSERLTATVSPDNAANKNVTWASENTAVATVDAAGTVTAVSAGTTVITVTTEDGGKTASCSVTVNAKNTGGGSSGGSSSSGSSGGSSSSSSSGSNTSSETTRNPDGSTTTTVTNKTTGTVTETTRNTDGSTTVVETKRDGTVTTTDTARNGVKAVTVSKPGTETSASVTLPASVGTATVTLPGQVTPGTVAVDARTGEIVKLSAPTGDGMVVKLDASAELILEDRSKAFTDIDGHWAKNAIDFTTAHALFSGTSDTTFTPDASMTRGMVAVVLHNFEGNPDFVIQKEFSDVSPRMRYYNAIHWITEKGITGGYGDGSFGIDAPVTREQLVTFLYRYANAMGYHTEGAADLSAFPDGARVSSYAAEAMRWAVGNGLIVGNKGNLAPGGNATRAQVAAILNRFVLNLMK